jgi:hypothetical protein
MKYICLGYIEPGKFEGMTEDERHARFDECFEYNDHLRANGHLVAGCPRFAPYFGANLGRETLLRVRRKLAFRDRARSIPTQSQPSLFPAGRNDENCSIPTPQVLSPSPSSRD